MSPDGVCSINASLSGDETTLSSPNVEEEKLDHVRLLSHCVYNDQSSNTIINDL